MKVRRVHTSACRIDSRNALFVVLAVVIELRLDVGVGHPLGERAAFVGKAVTGGVTEIFESACLHPNQVGEFAQHRLQVGVLLDFWCWCIGVRFLNFLRDLFLKLHFFFDFIVFNFDDVVEIGIEG